MTLKTLFLAGAALTLVACGNSASDVKDAATEAASDMVAEAKTAMSSQVDSARLETILAAQPDKAKARYEARHPKETLEFFGIAPGMTVVEALPGGGWYSKILIPYLGNEGHLVGVDYSIKMWPEFGGFATPEFVEKRKTWAAEWTEGAQAWRVGSGGEISAFTFGDRDTSMDGTVDAVLFVRALHNLARFEDEGSYLSEAIADAKALLKSGGIVGVVQHQGPEANDDAWAEGDNGYLKKSDVIAKFKSAGFEFVKESDVNANPKDIPTNDEVVWRLPPSLRGSRDNPELRAEMEAIGESNRMTLLFKKP
ncbi:class I SAM-dependent methyltransferase [Hellea balneolensis]|uniref:class I SAM-dependent methyltransferase n=1 Tax=Hellea balneolensis TaxID=287478 RepID=UPI00041809FF|nr:class I SAM-dependent methyltransferase [Hellea balneolensis]